ncbi:hypothetical protein Aduo_002486 [Ancylostoma duodenale]
MAVEGRDSPKSNSRDDRRRITMVMVGKWEGPSKDAILMSTWASTVVAVRWSWSPAENAEEGGYFVGTFLKDLPEEVAVLKVKVISDVLLLPVDELRDPDRAHGASVGERVGSRSTSLYI